MMREPLLVMYAVRNKDGQYFRAKGYGGYGETWVDALSKARIYPRPAQARSRVTYFAEHFPSFGVPELVELRVTEIVALNESTRVKKSQQKKAAKRARWAENQAKSDLERAERKMKEAQAEIDRLRTGKSKP